MIAIIGGGITGLTLADQLQQRGADVRLYEASDRVGGNIRSQREAGCLLELGPNSLRLNDFLYNFLENIGLSDDIVRAQRAARHRYVLRDGRYRRLPGGLVSLVFNQFLSYREKFRVWGERRVAPGTDADETIDAFFRRRFGDAVADYLVGPFISGIYAGDTERLLAAEAFPTIVEAEQAYGSVIKGMLRKRSKNQHKGIISLREGLEMIPQRLAARLGDRLQTGQPLAKLAPEGDKYRLRFVHGDAVVADQVVLAVPAYVAGDLLADFAPEAAAAFRAVPYPAVSLVHSLYKREDVGHRLDGFGALNNYLEGRKTLGTIFSSSTFAGRAPEGTVLLTTFVGGRRQPELALQPESAIFSAVHAELEDLLGVRGAPLFQKKTAYPRAIPQYEAAALPSRAAAAELERQGIWMAGNWIGGIAVVACIERAHKLCEQLTS